MKLVAVTMIKNDGDIVEAFVRHHATLVDHLVVLDHSSTDSTPAILQSLKSEGLPLTILHDASLSFQQGPRITDLARNAFARLGANFVFPLDADELLKVDSREALEHALSGIPERLCGRIPWQNYVVTEDDDWSKRNPIERMRFRARTETKEEYKMVLARSMLDDPRWQVSNGSHYLVRELANGTETAVALTLPGVHIAHFPLRSQEQLHQKIILGWLSYRLQNPVDIKAASIAVSKDEQFWHWKDLFVRTLHNPAISPALLQQYAVATYVHKLRIGDAPLPIELVDDAVKTGYSLKYTTADTGAALTSLARWTDQLLTRVGEML